MSSRRTHTKSRFGCAQCKRRKVKCDEIRPSCFNCTRHRISCSYGSAQEDLSNLSLGPPESTPIDSSFSVPRLDNLVNGAHLVGGPSSDSSPISSHAHGLDKSDGWRCDLELMHHYSTMTANTMASQESARHVWREIFPQEGYSHEFVMHGILSLAALHKAFLLPGRRDHYLTHSAHHYTIGQKHFRELLPKVNDDNWRPVFCFATLIIAYVLCLPAQTGDLKPTSPVSRTLELFTVTQGIKATLLPYAMGLHTSNLAPIVHTVWLIPTEHTDAPTPSLEFSRLPQDIFGVLARLSSFIQEDSSLDNKSDYQQAVSLLRFSAVQMAQAGISVEVGACLLWPFFLPTAVTSDIKQLKPHALILLSHYAVLLGVLEQTFWFLHGWAKQLVRDIDDQLQGQQRFITMLEWPKRNIST